MPECSRSPSPRPGMSFILGFENGRHRDHCSLATIRMLGDHVSMRTMIVTISRGATKTARPLIRADIEPAAASTDPSMKTKELLPP